MPACLNANLMPETCAVIRRECSCGRCCPACFCLFLLLLLSAVTNRGRVRVWHDDEGVYHDDTAVARVCQGRCRGGSCITTDRDLDQCFA